MYCDTSCPQKPTVCQKQYIIKKYDNNSIISSNYFEKSQKKTLQIQCLNLWGADPFGVDPDSILEVKPVQVPAPVPDPTVKKNRMRIQLKRNNPDPIRLTINVSLLTTY